MAASGEIRSVSIKRPICARALARSGAAVWNLEYRRLGDPGGNWSGLSDDVIRGAEHLMSPCALRPGPQPTSLRPGIRRAANWRCGLRRSGRRFERRCPVSRHFRICGALGRCSWMAVWWANSWAAPRIAFHSAMTPLPPGTAAHLAAATVAAWHGRRRSSFRHEPAIRKGFQESKLISLPGAGHFDLIDPRVEGLAHRPEENP